ncbi:estradiol 17-beta-dehydrogenase [Trifolium pratense]|uniref:Estradiol 17-beta-dehydrogenase n=1 Tax=Trifolium pratense TaxID=57577 RepID=A0A2K3MQX8_TRIPR|nr:estradiol 17-beta-dehydrogenase [Trifolium pratense]
MTSSNSAYIAAAECGNSVECSSNTVGLIDSKWEKPTQERYMCNIDASFSTQLNCVGIGTCIRDDEGYESSLPEKNAKLR